MFWVWHRLTELVEVELLRSLLLLSMLMLLVVGAGPEVGLMEVVSGRGRRGRVHW